MRVGIADASRAQIENNQRRRDKEDRMPALITITDFQKTYNVSRSTVYRLRDSGSIKFVHVGRSVRIPRESAEGWFASLIGDGANDQ